MKEAENPMVIDHPTIPTTKVFRVEVRAIITAIIDIVADDEEQIDESIGNYTDSIIAEADNCEIDDWEVIGATGWGENPDE